MLLYSFMTLLAFLFMYIRSAAVCDYVWSCSSFKRGSKVILATLLSRSLSLFVQLF